MSNIMQIIQFKGKDFCQKHGDYEYSGYRMGTKIIGNLCPKCRELMESEAEVNNSLKEEKLALADWHRRLNSAGLPEGFHEATLDNYRIKNPESLKMINLVKGYVQNFDKVLKQRPSSGLVFVGVPGTGKTHVACGMIQKMLQMGHSAAYLSCPQFLIEARDARNYQAGITVSNLIERYVTPRFLVLDEFGAHTTQDADYQNLYAIVDGRYQRNLPTLMLTNLTKEEVGNMIDVRFMERIRGLNGPFLAFDWPTERRANAKITGQ